MPYVEMCRRMRIANFRGKGATVSGIRSLVSAAFGWFYHPVLHRWRHKEEYKMLRPILNDSLSRMRAMRIRLPEFPAACSVAGRTAVQIHVFYTDLLAEFYGHLKGIEVPYDLYISTDTQEKKQLIEDFFSKHTLSAKKLAVEVFENRGRDVYPFLEQIHGRVFDYEYVAHFHTKKSVYIKEGDAWRQALLKKLFGGGGRFNRIIFFLSTNASYGLVIHDIPGQPVLKWGYAATKNDQWNQDSVKKEYSSFGFDAGEFDLREYEHSAGTMFIARVESVRQVFEKKYLPSDFPEERGQLKHTLQHTLELVWHPVCAGNGYKLGVV